MALLIVVDTATAIQEQTIKHLFLLRISEEERVLQAFFNFWLGLNRTGHPDWVKMLGDSNSQIKLHAKQKNTRFFLLQNTITASLQRGKTLLMSILVMILNNLMLWGFSNTGALENVKYPFIAFAPWSLLIGSYL